MIFLLTVVVGLLLMGLSRYGMFEANKKTYFLGPVEVRASDAQYAAYVKVERRLLYMLAADPNLTRDDWAAMLRTYRFSEIHSWFKFFDALVDYNKASGLVQSFRTEDQMMFELKGS